MRIQWIGALLVVGCGILLGWQRNRKEEGRLRQVEAWIALLRQTRGRVEGMALPVREILGRTEETLLKACGFEEDGTPSTFSELLSACRIEDRETEGVLMEFASGFGRGYREEEVRACDRYLRALEARREFLASHLSGRKRLNTTLSLAGSLAVVLLLL